MQPLVTLPAIIGFAALITFAVPHATADSSATVDPKTFVHDQLHKDKAVGERYFKEVNAKLDAVSKKLLSKLDEAEAKSFAKAHAKWIAWRDEEAEFLSHRYASTGNAVAAIQVQFEAIKTAMKAQLTVSRVEKLEEEVSHR